VRIGSKKAEQKDLKNLQFGLKRLNKVGLNKAWFLNRLAPSRSQVFCIGIIGKIS
jgi:hypothetical protein